MSVNSSHQTNSAATTELASPRFQTLLSQCVHCGLCLPACPTYAVFGTEMGNPRGRIALMRAVSDGRIGVNGAFREHVESCLVCRACEPACPSGVRYTELVETARIAIETASRRGVFHRVVRRLALRGMLPYQRRLRRLAQLLRIYQALGLPSLVDRLNVLPRQLSAMHALLPRLPSRYADERAPAPAIGERRGTVAFFHGCIQNVFLADVNAATVRVLQRNGYAVHFPAAQTCCGAVQLHMGEHALARELARRNTDASTPIPSPPSSGGRENEDEDEGVGYAAIINNAGGCGALLKDYARLLEDDSAYAEKAKRFSASVKDISEFLADHLNVLPTGTVKARVVYMDSCHLRNAQRVVRQPRDLMSMIPGLELVELARPDRCCGSAGIYNIVHADTANALLDAKMAEIAATGADTIVVANTGCHLQMLSGVRRAGLKARVAHVVQLLDQSYSESSNHANRCE